MSREVRETRSHHRRTAQARKFAFVDRLPAARDGLCLDLACSTGRSAWTHNATCTSGFHASQRLPSVIPSLHSTLGSSARASASSCHTCAHGAAGTKRADELLQHASLRSERTRLQLAFGNTLVLLCDDTPVAGDVFGRLGTLAFQLSQQKRQRCSAMLPHGDAGDNAPRSRWVQRRKPRSRITGGHQTRC